MKRTSLWSMLLVGCLMGCEQESQPSVQSPVVSDNPDAAKILSISGPITYENLTVFPVVSKSPQTADHFITLDEGLKSGTIEIQEGSDSGLSTEASGDLFGDPDSLGDVVSIGGPDPFDGPDPFEDSSESTEAADPFANASDPNEDVSDPFAGSSDPFASADDQAADQQQQVEQSNEEPSEANDNAVSLDDLFGSAEDLAAKRQQETAQAIFPAEEQISDEELEMTMSVDDIFGGGSGGQSVNQLFVINRSDKPLYLMPGELILGGDQDRMIAEETIIPPTGKLTPIDVYCVEQGRWGSREASRTIEELQTFALSEQSDSIEANYPANLSLVVSSTAEVNEGKFIASVGSVTNAVRKAAQVNKQQESVWMEVARENSKGTVMAPTGAFTANYVQADNLERLEPYLSGLRDPVADSENVVGVIVAINGELVSMDVFNSTPLFRKLWPKMLKGFSLQAANQPNSEDTEPCTVEDARQFLVDSIGASVTATADHGQIAVDRRESEEVICLSGRLSDEWEESLGGGMGGAMSGDSGFGAVHSASFPK